jgi:hypothetical protein
MSNALKITHFLIPLLFFSSLSFGQTENYRQDPEWIKHYQSKGFISSSLSVDDKGNYYSAGSFEQYLGLSEVLKELPTIYLHKNTIPVATYYGLFTPMEKAGFTTFPWPMMVIYTLLVKYLARGLL